MNRLCRFFPRRTGILAALLALFTVLMPMDSLAAQPALDDVHDAVEDLSEIPITGKGSNGQSFAGTFELRSFAIRNDRLYALGLLTGTLRVSAGQVQEVEQSVAFPVHFNGGTPQHPEAQVIQQTLCTILDLTLGPLDLTLLGLRVQLDQVDLLITGEPGLLGQLLCAINGLLGANLLDQLLGVIVILLNAVLDLL